MFAALLLLAFAQPGLSGAPDERANPTAEAPFGSSEHHEARLLGALPAGATIVETCEASPAEPTDPALATPGTGRLFVVRSGCGCARAQSLCAASGPLRPAARGPPGMTV